MSVVDAPVSEKREASPRPYWAYLLVLGAAASAAYPFVGSAIAEDVVYLGISLVSVAAIAAGARLHRPALATPWYLMAAGQLLWVAADAIYVFYEDVLGVSPFPSVADLFYLAAYPVTAWGLFRLIRGRRREDDPAGVVESLIVTAGMALLIWVVLVRPALADASGDLVVSALAIAYPVGDIVLLGGLVRLISSSVVQTASVRLLATALAMLVVADTAYDGFELYALGSSRILDYLWLSSYVLWGAASLHPSMATLSQPRSAVRRPFRARRLFGLAVATLIAPAAMALQRVSGFGDDVWGMVVGSTVLFLLVMVRMKIAFDEVTALSDQRALLQEELAYQASHDPLTELPNRAHALRRIRSAILADGAAQRSIVVMFLDLDGFKGVNDTHGHRAGDEVLVTVAARLSGGVRDNDMVARLGGDEFVVMLENVSDVDAAVGVAERLIETVSRPIVLSDGTEVAVGLSIGLTIGATSDVDAFLHEADLAVYRAKAAGKGVVKVFDEALRIEESGRAQLEAALLHAIVEDELVLRFQPVVGTSEREIRGFEALLRWERPGVGLVPPSDFIPVAERSDLIADVDTWALHAVAAQLARWNRMEATRDLVVSVNISGRHLNLPRVVDDVNAALREHHLPPRQLVIEVTETHPVDSTGVDHLQQLRALGLGIALDDFGTGYNSIDALTRLPVSLVKIDRSFIQGGSTSRQTLLQLLIRAAHSHHLPVVVEGIEREDQLERARSLGAETAQGFLFGQPLAPRAAEQLVRSRPRRRG